MKENLLACVSLACLISSNFCGAQTPDLSGKNFFDDETGNIVNLATGVVYKKLGDGTLLNLNSGEIYKRIADGTIIRLETNIKVPIEIR